MRAGPGGVGRLLHSDRFVKPLVRGGGPESGVSIIRFRSISSSSGLSFLPDTPKSWEYTINRSAFPFRVFGRRQLTTPWLSETRHDKRLVLLGSISDIGSHSTSSPRLVFPFGFFPGLVGL